MNFVAFCYFLSVFREDDLGILLLVQVLVGWGKGHAETDDIPLFDLLPSRVLLPLVRNLPIRSLVPDTEILSKWNIFGIFWWADPYSNTRRAFYFGLGFVESGLENFEL